MEEGQQAITHLVCIDIDGTLLCANHQISEANHQIIAKLNQLSHIKVVLATGRAPLSTAPIYEALGLSTPAICYNGALVCLHPAQPQNSIFNSRLPIGRIGFITEVAKDFDLTVNLFDGQYWYYDRIDHQVTRQSSMAANISVQTDMLGLINKYAAQQSGPNKAILMGRAADVRLARKRLEALKPEGITLYVVSDNYLEIMPKEVSKRVGVEAVQKHYQVATENIFAIGDGENDIEMLNYAGTSVAMHNGSVRAQAAAQHISPSHPTDALALALKDFFGF